MKKAVIALSVCLLGLSACVTPQYHKVASSSDELDGGKVNFQLSGLFYNDPPDCVTVMDTKAEGHPELARLVATALARHLGEKVDRVVFPNKRRALERKQGYDLSHKGDRRRYMSQEKCRFYARAELYDHGNSYAGVFARKHLGVKLDLARMEDDEPLWQAAHTVWRADGGMPLSPLSALGSFASASFFNADSEIMPSLADDVMRRMMRTLPPVIGG